MAGRIFSIVFVCFLCSACSKDPSIWEIRNLNNNQISVFGHGGMGISSFYPINSLQSIEESVSTGADGSEMDIQMSKDSVLFLFHSDRLEDQTLCTGYIYDKSAEEIECDYRSTVYKNIKVIKLEELFSLNFPDNFVLTFECKLKPAQDLVFEAVFARTLNHLIVKKGLQTKCFIESSHEGFLILLHEVNPALKSFLYTNDYKTGIESAERLELYGLTMDMHKITKEEIEFAHSKNKRITLFNQQNENDNIEAVRMSPDHIQTDKLKHLLSLLKE